MHSNTLSPQQAKQPSSTKLSVAVKLVCASFLYAAVAAPAVWSVNVHAADEQTKAVQQDFNIPAGPLAEALNRFAAASGIYLSGNGALTQNKTSAGLTGRHSTTQALNKLLQGTGVDFNLEGNTATLEAAAGVKTLDVVNVSDSSIGESAYGPVDGYVAKHSATGTKTDTPILETPRSISVITADQMENQDMETISEALRYTAGVMTEARGLDKTRPFIGIRGFYHRDATLIFRDGMLGSPFSSLLHPNIDLYGLERLEVLRGPASVLYGQGAPGGMVVTVTKRPTEEFFAEAVVSYGSFKQKGAKFDVSGPLDDEKKHLLRLTGLVADGDAQTDTLEDNRVFIAPAYTWRPTDSTILTLLGHYQKIDGYESTPLPPEVVGVLSNPNGRVPNSRFGGEPGHQFNKSKESALGYIFEQKFGDNVTLKHSLRYEKGDLVAEGTGGASLQADNRTIDRIGFTNLVSIDSTSTDTNLKFNFNTGAVKQTVLVGVDYRDAQNGYSGTCCFAVPSIDIYDPVYTGYTPGPVNYDGDDEITQTGFYAQDQINFNENWILNLGVRHDQADTRSKNNFTGEVTKTDDNATTFQVGAMYLFDNGIAPYASYAESFQPQGGTDFSGRAFESTTGEQYELGIKYQPEGVNLLATAAIYQITQQNILTSDLDHIGFNLQKGEVQSRGFETDIKTKLSNNIDLIASYSYTDIEVTKSNDDNQGTTLKQIPRHQASIWADYSFKGDFQGLVAGGGVRYVGSFPGDDEDTFNVSARTLFDLAVRYAFNGDKGLHLKLNVTNVFDKYYVTSCAFGNCYLGAARTAKLSMGYRW